VDAVCLGILVADIFSSPVDRVPRAGELKLLDSFRLSAGGCAVNTAACLRRLGQSVRVLGKVGQDMFGDFVVQDLARLGIDSSTIKRSATCPTSGTFILNVKGEDRRYFHLIGANADFSAGDLDPSALDEARVLHVGGFLSMGRFDSSALAPLFSEARRRSVRTVLDVLVPPGRTDLLNQLAAVLPHTDVFLPNEDEARSLTGMDDPRSQALRLAAYNPDGLVLITQGPRGVLSCRGTELHQFGAYRVESIDGSGAGDAFAAGIVHGLLGEWPLDRAIRFASALGASCTRSVGCTAGVFTEAEALAFINENPLPFESLE
jgi:sugar/nucleoside kinase (ribokinase family)